MEKYKEIVEKNKDIAEKRLKRALEMLSRHGSEMPQTPLDVASHGSGASPPQSGSISPLVSSPPRRRRKF